MPSEPRTEPTVDELSAYLDHELDAGTQARIAEHLAACADCQARLDGLRQTAYAIRALPMETPPRSFTIPEQRRQGFRWAPVGWVASAAAAVLVIGIGLSQLHFAGGAGSATSASYSNQKSAGAGAAAAPYAPAAGQDRSQAAAVARAAVNQVTVIDPRNGSRQLTVSTDRAAYPANATMTINGIATGDRAGQITLVLRRGNYGVRLPSPSTSAITPGVAFTGSYALSQLPLLDPRAGSYSLMVTWTDSSGATLIAELPVTITG